MVSRDADAGGQLQIGQRSGQGGFLCVQFIHAGLCSGVEDTRLYGPHKVVYGFVYFCKLCFKHGFFFLHFIGDLVILPCPVYDVLHQLVVV